MIDTQLHAVDFAAVEVVLKLFQHKPVVNAMDQNFGVLSNGD